VLKRGDKYSETHLGKKRTEERLVSLLVKVGGTSIHGSYETKRIGPKINIQVLLGGKEGLIIPDPIGN